MAQAVLAGQLRAASECDRTLEMARTSTSVAVSGSAIVRGVRSVTR